MDNRGIVKNIYDAFSRGDIPAILEKLHDKVEWEYGAMQNDVPWLQPRRGRAGVAKFFESLQDVQIHSFVPRAVLAGDNLVVALVDIEFTVTRTGKRVVENDEAHVWHFDGTGQIVRFRHCADTYQNVMACRG